MVDQSALAAYTRDLARGQRLIEPLQTGMTGLNVAMVSNGTPTPGPYAS